jgi:hypothetical protein
MRVLVTALLTLALLPATASAQIVVLPIPQDVSLAGGIAATHSPMEKTVRLTVSNHGPGTVASYVYVQLQVSTSETIVEAPGCTLQTVSPGSTILGRCELGSGLAEGETRTIDVRVRFVGIDYDLDYLIASVGVTPTLGGFPQGDANFANNEARMDLGILAPPPSMKVNVVVPGIVAHDFPTRHYYAIENTGGHDITNVVVTDDRCPAAQIASGSPVVRRAGGLLTLVCDRTTPPHRKGERHFVTHVTVTATSAGQTLTHTQAFTTSFQHPNRTCGTFRTRRKGKVTRWKASTTRPDVPCKRVRKQLLACRSRHRAPKGFRCKTFKNHVVITAKNTHDLGLMRALRA